MFVKDIRTDKTIILKYRNAALGYSFIESGQ